MRQVKTAFYLIKSKINRKGDAPVYIRIKFGGQTINLSTGMYLKPDDWDQKKLKVKLKHKQGLAFNNQLKNLEEKALAVCTNLIENGDRISLKKVKLILQDKVKDVETLISLVDYFISNIQHNPNYSSGTIGQYKSFRKKLIHFLSDKYSLTDLDLDNLNYEFITQLELFLSTVYGNKINTVTKNIKRLKAIINTGLKLSWLKDDPFKNYRCKSEPSRRQFLTSGELRTLHELDLSKHPDLILEGICSWLAQTFFKLLSNSVTNTVLLPSFTVPVTIINPSSVTFIAEIVQDLLFIVNCCCFITTPLLLIFNTNPHLFSFVVVFPTTTKFSSGSVCNSCRSIFSPAAAGIRM